MDFKYSVLPNLLEFLFKYGINKTTNFDLKDIADDLGINIKVLMRDELNNDNSLTSSNSSETLENYIIMTLEPSKDKGSHCIALSKKHNIYFDPYGILPTKEVYSFLKEGFKYNKIQLQTSDELCGQLSLYVLYCLDEGFEFEYTLSSVFTRIYFTRF